MISSTACLLEPADEGDVQQHLAGDGGGTGSGSGSGDASGSGGDAGSAADAAADAIADADADAGAGADAPADAGCAAQPEPECPAAPPGTAPQDPGIASGALCRGACGPSCPSTCRSLPAATTCLEWQTADCLWHAKVCTYPVIECGSHAGCRTHDACYDACATATFPALCRRQCDLDCVADHGVGDCDRWRRGDPPYDSWLSFAGTPTSYTYDSTCY